MHARNLVRGAVLTTSMFLAGCARPTVVPECPSPPKEPASPVDSDSEAPPPAASPSAGYAPTGPEPPSLAERTPELGRATSGTKPQAFDSLTGTLSPGFRTFYEDFLVAELALSHASDACSDACRALRSMVRSAESMCAIASSEEEQYRCEAARGRVRGARDHVRRACRVCSEGPPLDESE